MHSESDSPEHHRRRSEFIRKVVQNRSTLYSAREWDGQQIPKVIIQYWHNLQELPGDVEECIQSWARWQERGFRHSLFDQTSAREFIYHSFGAIHQRAFDRCYHPAMQADYFRLCYTGGSALKHYIEKRYLDGLGNPQVHIYDSDVPDYVRLVNQINNENDPRKSAFNTSKRELENYLQAETTIEAYAANGLDGLQLK